MTNCIDQSTLQAWFDGELVAESATSVTAHVSVCARCSEAARELEAENSMVAQALTAEFVQAVPTERLRQRVEEAIAGLPTSTATARGTFWSALREHLGSFRLPVYASGTAAILLAALLGIVYLRREKTTPANVQEHPQKVAAATPQSSPEPLAGPSVVKADDGNVIAKPPRRMRRWESQAPAWTLQERHYEKTIARLNAVIQSKPPMRPLLLVEYEHNLALIDHAIETTRDVARKNPKDPQAAQFVLAAYQSKVDLMNQIADARTDYR